MQKFEQYFDLLFQAEELVWGMATPDQKLFVHKFARAYGHLWAVSISEEEALSLSLSEIKLIAASRQRPNLPAGIEYPSVAQGWSIAGHGLGYIHTTQTGRIHVFVPFGADTDWVSVAVARPGGAYLETALDYEGHVLAFDLRGDRWFKRHERAWANVIRALFPDLRGGEFPQFPVEVEFDD